MKKERDGVFSSGKMWFSACDASTVVDLWEKSLIESEEHCVSVCVSYLEFHEGANTLVCTV